MFYRPKIPVIPHTWNLNRNLNRSEKTPTASIIITIAITNNYTNDGYQLLIADSVLVTREGTKIHNLIEYRQQPMR